MKKNKISIKITHFTELTDAQWAKLKFFIDTQRKIKKDLRQVLNCVLKITRTGCQWRNIDEKYGAWESIYYYYRKWTKAGIWGQILQQLVENERIRQGVSPTVSMGAIDSQSVKIVNFVGQEKGIDGNKKINGRKRNLVVDEFGLPLAIHVCAANTADGVAGIELLPTLAQNTPKLTLLLADKAYRGTFNESAFWCGYEVDISQKPPTEQRGFVPQKGRWQVERSFAWLNFYRRLNKDVEKTVQSAVAFIQIAFIAIILNR
ncbi:MAG: hypothetical protein RL757_404 [Bacteroidota bacterium]|jgi:transposase